MVYRLRNKNLFMTASGYKNNWAPNGFMMAKDMVSETTFNLKSRFDHHAFLRCRPI